jgi:hypothetical protein
LLQKLSLFKLRLPFHEFEEENVFRSWTTTIFSFLTIVVLFMSIDFIYSRIGEVKLNLEYRISPMNMTTLVNKYGRVSPAADFIP